jgi:hypothetical protein
MTISMLCIILLIPAAGAGDPVAFDDFFLDKVLRVDLDHLGTAGEERFCIHSMKAEPHFAGPKARLIDPVPLGTHRFDVFDTESGRRIYSRGFCTLFGEWQTTAEAIRGVTRVFAQTLIMPYPKNNVVLTISRRHGTSEMQEIFRQELSIGKSTVATDNPFFGMETVRLLNNGDPHEMVDIVILGDGYDARSMDDYLRNAREAMEELLGESPFKENRERFNFWAVKTPSPESGVDEPLRGSYKATLFDTSFNTFGLSRYSLAMNTRAISDAASLVPYDFVILIFNSPRYGGGGIYNLYSVVSGMNPAVGVLAHEMGHSMAGLGDEYVDSTVAYVDFYPRGIEPWEPNITSLIDGEACKWNHLIEEGTPIPTPDREENDGRIGCFEGAGYKAEGLYRPNRDCIMRSCRNGFCPVCREALLERIRFFTR